MYSTVLAAVLFLVASRQRSFAEESSVYGYLINKGLYEIPCGANPMPDVCSFKHQVPESGKMMQMNITQTLDMFKMYSQGQGQGSINPSIEKCASTVQNHICTLTFQLTCTDDYIIQNLDGIKRSCKKAELYCANVTKTQFPFKAMINCSTPIEPIGPQKRRPGQQGKCEHFPEVQGDPLPCTKRNYKILALNLTQQARTQVAAHERLAKYTSNITQKCLDDVAETICKNVAPACDKNETMAVALLSRQECDKIISCLNTTSKVKNLTEGLLEMCRTFPDGDVATKIPLSLVYLATTYNETKISPQPATESHFKNQTSRTENQNNATDESKDPSSPTLATEKPAYFNTTAQDTGLTAETKNPPTQTNISKPSTEKPTVNVTYQEKKTAKTVQRLKPTTESLLNLNGTTQLDLNLSDSTQDQPGRLVNRSVLIKTPQVSATPSFVSSVTETSRPVFNATAIRHSSVLFNANSTNVSIQADKGKAAHLNPTKNLLAGFLLISTLSIYTWL